MGNNLNISFKINIEKLETADLMFLKISILFMNLDIVYF